MSTPRQWVGSIIFTVFLFISVVVYSTIVVLLSPFGPKPMQVAVVNWAGLVLWALELFCDLKCTLEGRENLPDQPGVALVKHSSALETIVGWKLLPRQTWVLKRELMWVPFFGWALAVFKPIAINRKARGSTVEQVVTLGQQRLAAGIWVIIFPEGTRMPPGETKRYGVSAALLATRSGCPLVPIAHNAGFYWPRRGWLKRPGTVRFVIGAPIATEGRNPREINSEAQAWIESTIAAMADDGATDAS
jgi:1-acyl-sn-glycerol-3-phosphate acyltransferase